MSVPAKLGSGSRPPARPGSSGAGVVAANPSAVPSKAVKAAVGKPAVPPQPKKASSMKKTVNYERQMGVVTAPPTGQTVAHQQRKHSDTLASMPMQDKMKAFESAGAADSRRNFWIKRAEEKKAVAAKPKAPVGQAPRPPATKAPTPQRPNEQQLPPRDRDDPSRQSVRASPQGVANLSKNFVSPNSPKAPPRVAAPKPPAKAPPKKTVSAPIAPPVKRGPTAEELRMQEEEELAAFEAEEAAAAARAEEAAAAARAVEEERKRRAAEEKRRQEEERKRQEEQRKREEEEKRRKREEEERRKRELEEEEKRRKAAAAEKERQMQLQQQQQQQQQQQKKAASSAPRTRTVDLLISLADYEGNAAEGELSFGENEYILLMRRDDTGWWQGEIGGVLGWLPSNFCRETTDEEFELYCSQCGIEPYVEEEKPVVVQKPEPPKAPEKKTAPATAAKTNASASTNANAKAALSNSSNSVSMGTANGPNKLMQAFGKPPTSMDEFEIQGLLGKGRFGKVYQCRKKDTGHIYAIKALLKTHIESSEAQKILVEREKAILMKIKGPFLVRCYHIFEDSEKLYFVMECASGGELFVHLSREKIFDPERVRFYAAEMFLGLEYLHSLGIVYRDMKPENVLLTAEGHILMTDFGISKEGLDNNSMRTATFCGTPEYLAPEVLLGQGYGKAVDWWSYGSVCYEMLTGLPPYYSEDITEMYKKILQAPLEIPPECDKASRDFLTALLDRNPEKRLQDPRVIRKHPYFRGVDWDAMYNMRVPAPYIPPEEFVYDDDDDAPVEDDAFADFDGQVYDDSVPEVPDDGQLRCRSHHDWPGEADGDLALRVGDIIIVIDNQSDPEGWWTGECEADGRQGSFPSNFVQLL